jgi:hypothetical protein
MILDNNNMFSDQQAITATADSTNVLDLGAPGTPYGAPAPVEQDVGKANYIPLMVNVTQAFNNLTSLNVAIQTSPDNSTWTVGPSETYTLTQLGLSQLPFPAQLPIGVNARYMKLTYTVTGTAPTTGKISAGIVAARQSNLH